GGSARERGDWACDSQVYQRRLSDPHRRRRDRVHLSVEACLSCRLMDRQASNSSHDTVATALSDPPGQAPTSSQSYLPRSASCTWFEDTDRGDQSGGTLWPRLLANYTWALDFVAQSVFGTSS